MKNTFRYILVLVPFLLALGCKKEEQSTTLPSISGLEISEAIPFTRVGETQGFILDIEGLYTSDATDPGQLGVFWTLNGGAKDTLSTNLTTSNPVFYVNPSTTGNYTVMASVFAVNGKYYAGAVSTAFQVIDPDTALTGLDGVESLVIDGNRYRSIDAGGLTWLGSNLYGTESGRDYRGCEVVSKLFGRYYTWEEAQTACPEGWRLPTAAEFDLALGDTAGDLMVNAQFMSIDMWTYWPQVTITNKLMFNAIPTGYVDLTTNQEVFGYKEYACWWTADDNDEDLGMYRYIYQDEPNIMKGKGSKTSLALNVRCVKAEVVADD